MSDAKFSVDGVTYDFPTQIRLGDAALVREFLGLEIEDLEDAGIVTRLTAYLAIAVWQANPRWTRAKVLRFLEAVDIQKMQVEGGEDGPPENGAATPEQTSPASSNGSTTTPADSVEEPASETTRVSSGDRISGTFSG